MRNLVWVILLVAVARAQRRYKLCAPADAISDVTCLALQKGESQVQCLRVADSAECAIRLAQNEADFGVFNAEELILAYRFYPSQIEPIIQLRHKDKPQDEFEFQAVAVTLADLTQIAPDPNRGFGHLKNSGLCHPGFSKSQWWNNYILKYFEKTVNPPTCRENVTVIENELRNLRDFFGKACRPGEWAADSDLDRELKSKYPELCALCDDPATCSYTNRANHGHLGALKCLTSRRGKVAYVALSYVQQHLQRNASYEFLCPDGMTAPLSTSNPCAWIKQPWSVIAARKDIADIKPNLSQWLQQPKESWQWTLSRTILEDSIAVTLNEKMSISSYVSKGRDIELGTPQTCDRIIRWCTTSDLETNKCEWVARAAKALGIEPNISCVNSKSTFQCFRNIAEKEADIITIDSNYGYLARTMYGLSTILYSDTETEKNSVIIAVVREPKDDNYPVKSFHDLKGRSACFPEYSGISWLSFVKVARMSGIISSKSCDYPLLVSRLLSGACAPGIKDADHSRKATSEDVSSKLCSACMHRNNTSCAVNETNRYYGDKGAMRCISEEAGDVAFVEAANINDNKEFEPNKYRILCKNGSLATNPGLNFDEICALSVTIDSEVIGRKNDSYTTTMDIVLALLKIEDWLGYRINARRPIHVYGPFNGTIDLLFKDSSSGLLSTSSTKKTVIAYKELFSHVDACSTGSLSVTANLIFVTLVALYHFLHLH